MRHIHILGIGGTFMSSLAILAKEAGYQVTGVDEKCYPPVSDLLVDKGIAYEEGYHHINTALRADMVVVGNAIKRGMPVIEAVMNAKKPYMSGPDWLATYLLPPYEVLAVCGTHGKTTTTSMVTHMLAAAGFSPSFLIGGVSQNTNTSACLTKGRFFVIEADEYDTAFFDKRPKFMHYRPSAVLLNNLEFDHADIYENLEAIQKQMHYLMRTIPENGTVIKPLADKALNEVIAMGQYSQVVSFSSTTPCDWQAVLLDESGSRFEVYHQFKKVATIEWSLVGRFNVENALAAIALASSQKGVFPEEIAPHLSTFKPVKRRLEVTGEVNKMTVYDDFAHHPTAIEKTLDALIKSRRHQRHLVVIEFASFTMKSGVHGDSLMAALKAADKVYVLEPSGFDMHQYANKWACPYGMYSSTDAIIAALVNEAKPHDGIIVMSNRGFEGIHLRLLDAFSRQ